MYRSIHEVGRVLTTEHAGDLLTNHNPHTYYAGGGVGADVGRADGIRMREKRMIGYWWFRVIDIQRCTRQVA